MDNIFTSQTAINDADDFLEMLTRNRVNKTLKITALLEERDRVSNILTSKKRIPSEKREYLIKYKTRLTQLVARVRR